MPQSSQSGLFRAGAIDLTGDGASEQVQLVDEQVAVYRDGVEVWRGLPGWRVTNLALGDPNDDGRADILLASAVTDSPPTPERAVSARMVAQLRVAALADQKGSPEARAEASGDPGAVPGVANGERSPADAL